LIGLNFSSQNLSKLAFLLEKHNIRVSSDQFVIHNSPNKMIIKNSSW
jgi:hypothetical protein